MLILSFASSIDYITPGAKGIYVESEELQKRYDFGLSKDKCLSYLTLDRRQIIQVRLELC